LSCFNSFGSNVFAIPARAGLRLLHFLRRRCSSQIQKAFAIPGFKLLGKDVASLLGYEAVCDSLFAADSYGEKGFFQVDQIVLDEFLWQLVRLCRSGVLNNPDTSGHP
jgi:hypothetical protein